MDPIAQLVQPRVGEIKEEFNKDNKWVTVHYHNSSIKGIRSKTEMKPYEVGGHVKVKPVELVDGKRINKKNFFEKGLFCPKCYRTVKN